MQVKCKERKASKYEEWTKDEYHDWTLRENEEKFYLLCINCLIKKSIDTNEHVNDYLSGLY